MDVRIVTDSSAALPKEWIARDGVGVVPLTISLDGEDHRNGELTYEDFEARCAAGAVPTTSAPSPGEYQQAYDDALSGAGAVLVIMLAAEVSATFSNATLASQAFGGERVHVMDSRTAAAGQGLVVAAAAAAATAGLDIKGVSARAADVAARVRLWATLERLDHLRRSGRVPAVAALATGALDLHPIFRFVEGSPSPVGAARGGHRAADKIFRAWRASRSEDDAQAHVFVFHASRADDAGSLWERVLEEVQGADTAVVAAGAAMAAHTGPGMLGLAWWWEPA